MCLGIFGILQGIEIIGLFNGFFYQGESRMTKERIQSDVKVNPK